jgi:quercetin dioxygenase-like cupin family protein
MSNAAEAATAPDYTPDSEDRTAKPSEVVHEDERSRMVRYTIEPGEQTGWHHHQLDYVVIYLTDGELTSHFADGTSKVFNYERGKSSAYKAPVEHNAVNTGDTTVIGFEIELKP